MTDDTTPTERTAPTDDRGAATTTEEPPAAPDSTVRDALAEHAVALETTDPAADRGDLAPLRDAFADARVVGLGEATHGTREFFRAKHRLIRYLVTELGVRTFALEANFPEALALDDYVVRGTGTATDALDGVYFWTWNVEAVRELVEWLRAFNADQPLDDRVRFYGFDAQYTRGAVDRLRAFFERHDPEFLATVRDDLDTIDDDGTPPNQDEHRPERFDAAERAVPRLRDRLDERRETYVADGSESAWELARQHVRVVEQATEYKRGVHALDTGDDEATAMERTLRVRDRAMADNVDWILDREEPGRMVVWGHDAHLNRVEHAHRRTDAAATSMGGHLADRHGDDYYALGFSFGRGAFQAVGPDDDGEDDGESHSLQKQVLDGPVAGTIDETLSDLDRSLAVVDLRAASDDERVADWLAEPREHFSVGATYDGSPKAYLTSNAYGEAFDAVCYVDETTRARPLGRD